MAFFALADLHLGLAVNKPMDVFGERWRDHQERLVSNWRNVVKPADVVLVPGDISWAMKLNEVTLDLNLLAELPGRKVLIRGNHDYWWQSLAKVRAMLPTGMIALQNDHVVIDEIAVCGTRGWSIPRPDLSLAEEDDRLLTRERQRLELSLRSTPPGTRRVVMIHFPPCYRDRGPRDFADLLEAHQVELCVYGHLHGDDHQYAFQGKRNGINYVFCAADAVDFTPVRLPI